MIGGLPARRGGAALLEAARRLRPGRGTPAFFDAAWYLARNPDVAAAGMDPWRHWRRFGRAEGRAPAPMEAMPPEDEVWAPDGPSPGALDRLRRSAREGGPAERVTAAATLARLHGSRGDWAAAADALRGLRAVPGWGALVDPGPLALLSARALARAGTAAEARAALRALPRASRALARADAAQAAGAGPEAMVAALSAVLRRAGLEPITGGPGSTPLDGLAAAAPPRGGPLVTVIVPARDAGATIDAALRGILAQTWRALDVVVVDNASADDTAARARAWASRDGRVRVLACPEPGAYPARNLGLAEARGAYVTVHDADDWSHPRKLEAQMRPMLRPAAPAATVSHWLRLTEDLTLSPWREGEAWVHRNVSSLLFAAALRDRLGYWDRVRASADTEYWMRIRATLGEGAVREVHPGVPLSVGRVSAGSLTREAGTHAASQAGGARALYHEAAARWHARAGPGGLRLPRRPERRPFDAPDALSLGDPPAVLEPDDHVRRSPRFDARWYLDAHPDVRRDGREPAVHYATAGRAEGRDPGPAFSTSGWTLAHGSPPEPLPETDDPLPLIPGALAGPARVVVIGHEGGREVFGAERSLLDMLDRLAAEGRPPLAVLPRALNGAYAAAVLARATGLHVVPYLWRREGRAPHPDTVAALRRILARANPEEVHVNTLTLDAPLIAARAEEIPTCVHVRELPAEDPALCAALGSDPRAIRARLLAEADRFVANSPLVAEWLDVPARVRVRGNAVDPALFALPPAAGRRVRAALIGSNVAKKGIADAVAIARAVPEVEVRLVGPRTPDLAALGGLPTNAACSGYADGPAAALGGVHVVLSLSHFAESFGRTVLEGMAAGRPVVAYAGGMPERLVAHGETGFVVPRGDVAAAAAAVRALAADPERLAAMGRAARERARGLAS